MARAFRRALVGSLILAVFSIAIATWASVGLEHSEARAPDPTPTSTETAPVNAVSASLESAPDASTVLPPSVEVFGPLAPDLDSSFDEGVEPPALAASVVESPAVERRVRAQSSIQAAGPPPALTPEERRDALIANALKRGDDPVIAEPPFPVTGSDAGSPPLAVGSVIEATISFYYCELGDTESGGDGGGFCGPMRDGTVVYEGAAACALTYLGQQFRIVGDPTERIYTCNDTGSAVHGLHRDIFFHHAEDGWPWLQQVGTLVVLEIVG